MNDLKSSKGDHISRRAITDTEKAAWALARYESFGNGRGNLTPLKDLADRFRRDKGVISRGIQEAFSKRFVKVVSAMDPEEIVIHRNDQLETLLLEQFSHVKIAIVIDVIPPTSNSPKVLKDYNDDVHRKLGIACARIIIPSLIELDHKKLALSSGRGVYSVVHELRQHRRLKANQVTLLSLTGSMFFQTSQTAFAPMDADIITQEMRSCFPPDAMVKIIGVTIAHLPAVLRSVTARTWLGEWKKYVPDYAILGVGVLCDGHRFWEYATAANEELKLHLDPISQTLKDLVAACKQWTERAPDYCPVADIANHLFFVDPPVDIIIPPADKALICNLVNQINRHLLNVQATQLKEIQNLILVAGTQKKALAIRRLLDHYSNLSCITVDSEVARILLSRK
jgi:DNA-binding transcriptional regulator LsrR (DeoR family)